MRLLLHAALEEHQLTEMFWDTFVLRIYEFLGSYIRERQQDGAFREVEPEVVVRALIGMVMHHSLNNNLWDPTRRLLNISNERAAQDFTEILLKGITAATTTSPQARVTKRAVVAAAAQTAATRVSAKKKKQTK